MVSVSRSYLAPWWQTVTNRSLIKTIFHRREDFLRAVAAATKEVMTTADCIMCHLTVHVLHAVYCFNPQEKKKHSPDHSMSTALIHVLLTLSHVILKSYTVRHRSANLSTTMPLLRGRPNLTGGEVMRTSSGGSWLQFRRWVDHHNRRSQSLSYHAPHWFTCNPESNWCHLYWYSDTPSITEWLQWTAIDKGCKKTQRREVAGDPKRRRHQNSHNSWSRNAAKKKNSTSQNKMITDLGASMLMN